MSKGYRAGAGLRKGAGASSRAVRSSSVSGARRQTGRVTSKGMLGSRFAASPQSLAAAEAVTTAAVVTYDLIGVEDKTLPSPGPILATIGFFSALGFVASVSETFAPVVVAAGWVLALAVLVTGKRGRGIVHLLNQLASLAARTNPAAEKG